MTVAAMRELASKLVWQVDGNDVPVAPPPWNASSASANMALCAHISAYNSYVSAVADREAAEALLAAKGSTSAPKTKRRTHPTAASTVRCATPASSPATRARPALPASSPASPARRLLPLRRARAAAYSTGDAPDDSSAGDAGGGMSAAEGGWSADEGAAAEAQQKDRGGPDVASPGDRAPSAFATGVVVVPRAAGQSGTGKSTKGDRLPRIQVLRSGLTKRMHADVLEPSTNDAVLLPGSAHTDLFRDVVMSAAKVSAADADKLLKTAFLVPPAVRGKQPSSKILKPWLGKTLNNVHFNLRKAISRAWIKATKFRGGAAAARGWLKGRRYVKGRLGRLGLVLAFLAALAHCSADPRAFTFPDGRDGPLLRSLLATLAFVCSTVRCREGLQ